jgi:hypothetical protein
MERAETKRQGIGQIAQVFQQQQRAGRPEGSEQFAEKSGARLPQTKFMRSEDQKCGIQGAVAFGQRPVVHPQGARRAGGRPPGPLNRGFGHRLGIFKVPNQSMAMREQRSETHRAFIKAGVEVHPPIGDIDQRRLDPLQIINPGPVIDPMRHHHRRACPERNQKNAKPNKTTHRGRHRHEPQRGERKRNRAGSRSVARPVEPDYLPHAAKPPPT